LPRDDAFSPDTATTRTVPATIGVPPGTTPSSPKNSDAIPEPDDITLPSKPVSRPENVAGNPHVFTPPVTSIPGPGVPTYPVPPVSPPANPGPKQSRVRAGANFALVDTLGRDWNFATANSSSFVLVEFMTTNCQYCKPVVPTLMGLQSKYGADGLQVVAVLCDEVPLDARITAADRYARMNNVNYAVYVEPGAKPGAVRKQFGFDSYPSAVLLDATGTVLWRGNPGSDRTKLEAAVKAAMGK
jgi:thiol-disulfide isomerase/thioredoxin